LWANTRFFTAGYYQSYRFSYSSHHVQLRPTSTCFLPRKCLMEVLTWKMFWCQTPQKQVRGGNGNRHFKPILHFFSNQDILKYTNSIDMKFEKRQDLDLVQSEVAPFDPPYPKTILESNTKSIGRPVPEMSSFEISEMLNFMTSLLTS